MTKIIGQAIYDATEVVTISAKNTMIKHWIIKEVLLSIRKRDKMFHKVRHIPANHIKLHHFRVYRNRLKLVIQSAKELYAENKLQQV